MTVKKTVDEASDRGRVTTGDGVRVGHHVGAWETLALIAGALRADGTSPMPGAGAPYRARATLVGATIGRAGPGQFADLMFEDVAVDPSPTSPAGCWVPMAQARLRDRPPVLRLWTSGAGRAEAARILGAVFSEAEADASIRGDRAGGLAPRRVRLLLVDVDPAAFEGAGDAPPDCPGTEDRRHVFRRFGLHYAGAAEDPIRCAVCFAARCGATALVTYAIGIGRDDR